MTVEVAPHAAIFIDSHLGFRVTGNIAKCFYHHHYKIIIIIIRLSLSLESSSKDLPQIYHRFTTNLPRIYQRFTKSTKHLPTAYQQLPKYFFNLPRIYHRFTNTILELNIFVLELSIVKDDDCVCLCLVIIAALKC